ncbi:hypothetical protein [Thiobaca trueperi]|uniref:Uncharacterized protein n=1 Tax=Thiobaca trueperi TaxID=127458 RepID=A0A4R3MWK8_9GAMM|nr:hypothetical protein [Thiobaca trueperi]TCT20645.1 hypothetical protein EDC35_10584 [Thiobaca trueperi]
MSLRWSAKHWPIIEQAKRGLLPERLSIAEIAQLHPLGDDFAKTLLEECTIYMHRQGNGLPIDDVEAGFSPPPPEAGEGLRFDEVDAETQMRRMREHPNLHEIDPPDSNPYNGHFYLIHRDDLRIYLQKEGEWPLPMDADLHLWWEPQAAPRADEASGHHSTMEATAIKTRERDPLTTVVRECFDAYRREKGEYPQTAHQCLDRLGNHWQTPCGIKWSRSEGKMLVNGEPRDRQTFGRRFQYVKKQLTGN